MLFPPIINYEEGTYCQFELVSHFTLCSFWKYCVLSGDNQLCGCSTTTANKKDKIISPSTKWLSYPLPKNLQSHYATTASIHENKKKSMNYIHFFYNETPDRYSEHASPANEIALDI